MSSSLHRYDDRITAAAARQVGATPAGDYTFRPPSPPHIHVPPAIEDKTINVPSFIGAFVPEHQRHALQYIAQSSVHVKAKEWKYTNRREAQSVVTYLYLGPASAARDLAYLQQEGITMMLAIRDTNTGFHGLYAGKKAMEELGIPTKFIDVNGSQQLITRFSDAADIINDHLVEEFHAQGGYSKQFPVNAKTETPKTWGKVLVFCESGNERSPAVIAAYLMSMYEMDHILALQYIQQQRFCVAFDDSMKHLIRCYDDILIARRGARPNEIRTQLITKKSKRARDEVDRHDENDDMDLDDENDRARFGGRTAFAPFIQRTDF